jgi:hypothetical protein
LGTFFFVTFAYGIIHCANNALTEFLHLVPGAHLFHIPSGFKFLFVLIAGWVGAAGIAVASLASAFLYTFPDQWMLAVELAFINGLAPFLAVKLFVQNFGLEEDLSNINQQQVLWMGLLFVFLNSGLNQLILFWNNFSDNFLDDILVMLIGDITGTFVVLTALIWITKKLKLGRDKDPL